MKDIEVIKAARDRIASGQWWKGAARSAKNPQMVCTVTAISDAAVQLGVSTTDDWSEGDKITAMVETFVPVDFKPFKGLRSIAAYNDHPDTTQQDIVNLFDKALAELGGLE